MPINDFPSVLEIKDPLHGYIHLTELEKSILDLRVTQRLRGIRCSGGMYLVYSGADSSLMGSLLGNLYVTEVFLEYLGGDLEEVLKARLAAMILKLTKGPWSNVMDEYLSRRGINRTRMAKLIIEQSEVTDLIQDSSFTVSETVDLIEKGVPLKGVRIDLQTSPINPELIDALERDSYFAGVEYAQMEFRRIFTLTRIAKNKMAFERGSLFTLESYLSAGITMYDAIYYHKTVRAAELMQLRILDEAGSQLLPSPADETNEFLKCDDITLDDYLLNAPDDASPEVKSAQAIFLDLRRRYLIKVASVRAISDSAFLDKISTPDGLFEVEREIAEDAGIDPTNVYVDYPTRDSVVYYPGRIPLDDLVLFERGSKGYEFWALEDLSHYARSFKRRLWPIRVYTTRGYRTRVKKSADNLLESVDTPGEM